MAGIFMKTNSPGAAATTRLEFSIWFEPHVQYLIIELSCSPSTCIGVIGGIIAYLKKKKRLLEILSIGCV